jgi:hypothetical protein
VKVWLEETGQKDAMKVFQKNGVTGETLSALTNEDLVSMKIDKLGTRKAILKNLEEVLLKTKSTKEVKDKEVDSSVSSTTGSSKSIKGPVATIHVTGDGTDGFTVPLAAEADVRFTKLVRKLERKLGYLPVVIGRDKTLKLNDTLIEDQADWALVWRQVGQMTGEKQCHLHVRKPLPNDIGKVLFCFRIADFSFLTSFCFNRESVPCSIRYLMALLLHHLI